MSDDQSKARWGRLDELLRQMVRLLPPGQTMDDRWYARDEWAPFLQAHGVGFVLPTDERPSVAEIDAAGKALWQVGNARIGERPWESVCAHYIAEATDALEAAAAVRKALGGAAGGGAPSGSSAEFFDAVANEALRAMAAWPNEEIYHRIAALTGEVGELAEGVIKTRPDVEREAIQVAACAYRCWRSLLASRSAGETT